MSLVFNMVGGSGGAGGMSTSDALIHVNAPVGSTVEFAKGGVTAKTITPDKAFPNIDGETADYYYSVSSANFGVWTITATLSGDSTSGTVTVNAVRQYDLELSFSLWLVHDGIVNNLYMATNAGGTYSANVGYIQLHSVAGSGTYATLYFSPQIDVTDYSTLVLDAQVRGYFLSPVCPAVGLLNNISSGNNYSTFTTSTLLLTGGTGTLQDRATYTLDISSMSGLASVGFQEAGSGNSGWQGDIYCYNLYLTK